MDRCQSASLQNIYLEIFSTCQNVLFSDSNSIQVSLMKFQSLLYAGALPNVKLTSNGAGEALLAHVSADTMCGVGGAE